ncbi:M48 family metalloprotease, partial [Hydrogenibacillus schlegelii]|uniref:M48 family metalloprotease n=1 Tax=Hydrogenibacillus schlegelii TaxID=1484 RepID=UPI0034A08305
LRAAPVAPAPPRPVYRAATEEPPPPVGQEVDDADESDDDRTEAGVAVGLVGDIVLLADLGGWLFCFGAVDRVGWRRSDRGGPEALLLLLALLVLFLAPLAAQLTRFALSRNREFYADAQAVNFTRNPRGLIKALTRLKEAPAKVARATEATADLYFVNPFGDVKRWFRTHPPIEERIRRLEAM